MKYMPSREDMKVDFKRKSTKCVQDNLKKRKERIDKAQIRCNKNHDARLHNQSEVLHVDDYEYLWLERKNSKDRRHKLAPVAKGPFKVTRVD